MLRMYEYYILTILYMTLPHSRTSVVVISPTKILLSLPRYILITILDSTLKLRRPPQQYTPAALTTTSIIIFYCKYYTKV